MCRRRLCRVRTPLCCDSLPGLLRAAWSPVPTHGSACQRLPATLRASAAMLAFVALQSWPYHFILCPEMLKPIPAWKGVIDTRQFTVESERELLGLSRLGFKPRFSPRPTLDSQLSTAAL